MASIRQNILTAIVAAFRKLDLGGNPRQRVNRVTEEWRGAELEGNLPLIVVLDPSEDNFTGSNNAPLQHYLNEMDVFVFVILDAGNRDESRPKTMRRALAAAKNVVMTQGVPDTGTVKQVNGVNWWHLKNNQMVEFGSGGNVVAVKLGTSVLYLHSDIDANVGRQ